MEYSIYISVIVIAPEGQTASHDLHPRHWSPFTGTALPSCSSKTDTGQIVTHSPSPVHFSLSTFTIYIYSTPDWSLVLH